MQFQSYAQNNKYNKRRKIKKIVYKCIFNRYEEKFRISTNQTHFVMQHWIINISTNILKVDGI